MLTAKFCFSPSVTIEFQRSLVNYSQNFHFAIILAIYPYHFLVAQRLQKVFECHGSDEEYASHDLHARSCGQTIACQTEDDKFRLRIHQRQRSITRYESQSICNIK
jgi:hypothetical protein